MKNKRQTFCLGCEDFPAHPEKKECPTCRRMTATCVNCEHVSYNKQKCDELNCLLLDIGKIENCIKFKNRRL